MKSTVTSLILLVLLSINTYAVTGEHQRTFIGHTDAVNSVAFSPDGRTLASGSADRTVQLWDTKTTGPKWLFILHGDAVSSIIFSPDSTTLASGCADGKVMLWDAKTGTHKGVLFGLGRGEQVYSVAFSPDGRTLASGDRCGTVWLWDVETSMPKGRLIGRSGAVYSVAFNPILASGSGDKTVRLWDTITGELKTTLDGHTGEITMVAFSPDGKILASGGRTINRWYPIMPTRDPKDNTVRLRSQAKGYQVREFLKQHAQGDNNE